MKTENPERIYVEKFVGTNGIHCLDYKNYDDSIEYIRSDLVNKELEKQNEELIYLIKKYLEFVSDVEGTDFIEYYPSFASDVMFSENELKLLERIKQKPIEEIIND